MLPYTHEFSIDSLLENAYELIEAGVPIIQLHPMDNNGNCTCNDPNCRKVNPNTGEVKTLAGKHPMIKSWQKAPVPASEYEIETAIATLDSTIHPSSTGLGAVLPEDIIIVDVDCKKGKQGYNSLQKLEHHIGQKLETVCGYKVTSGSGAPSAHYWFKKPSDMEVRKTLKEYPDIDFLHKGNYVVIQGSCHQSGGIYQAEYGQSISRITLAPEKLLKIIEREKVDFSDRPAIEAGACDMRDITQALEYILAEHQGAVPYGDWFRCAMALHFETGGSQEGYELFDEWSSKGTNYSGASDTARKWQEGFKSSAADKISGATILWMAQELGWERDYGVEVDLSAFIESLRQGERAKVVSREGKRLEFGDIPKELQNFTGVAGVLMEWSLENSKKPSYLISLAATLHTLSVILSRDFKTDTDSYASIYQMVVAKTGRGKEQVMKVANKTADSMIERFPNEISTMMTDATSASAMYSALEIMPRRGVVLDEVAHILEAIAANKGNNELIGLTRFYLEVFGRLDGTYVPKSMSTRGLSKEDRKKVAKDIDIIRRPAVSIVGLTTPVSFMNVLTRKMMQDGFINRFLMWFPQEGRQPIRLEQSKPVPETLWHWMERLVTELGVANDTPKSQLVRDDPEHPIQPCVVKLKGTEAEEIWRDFEEECGEESERVEEFGFEDIYARAPEIAIRIALILQLSENACAKTIEPHIMTQACALVRFSKKEEAKCYMLDFSENETEKREKKIFNFIAACGEAGVSKEELYASPACSGLKAQESREALESLKAKGKVGEINKSQGRGRPPLKDQFVYSTEFIEYPDFDEE